MRAAFWRWDSNPVLVFCFLRMQRSRRKRRLLRTPRSKVLGSNFCPSQPSFSSIRDRWICVGPVWQCWIFPRPAMLSHCAGQIRLQVASSEVECVTQHAQELTDAFPYLTTMFYFDQNSSPEGTRTRTTCCVRSNGARGVMAWSIPGQ